MWLFFIEIEFPHCIVDEETESKNIKDKGPINNFSKEEWFSYSSSTPAQTMVLEQWGLPYSFDQTPLSNCRHTSRRVEWNRRLFWILAAANIWVAHAHMNEPHDSTANKQKQAKNKLIVQAWFKLHCKTSSLLKLLRSPPTPLCPLLYPQRGLHHPLLVQRQEWPWWLIKKLEVLLWN